SRAVANLRRGLSAVTSTRQWVKDLILAPYSDRFPQNLTHWQVGRPGLNVTALVRAGALSSTVEPGDGLSWVGPQNQLATGLGGGAVVRGWRGCAFVRRRVRVEGVRPCPRRTGGSRTRRSPRLPTAGRRV